MPLRTFIVSRDNWRYSRVDGGIIRYSVLFLEYLLFRPKCHLLWFVSPSPASVASASRTGHRVGEWRPCPRFQISGLGLSRPHLLRRVGHRMVNPIKSKHITNLAEAVGGRPQAATPHPDGVAAGPLGEGPATEIPGPSQQGSSSGRTNTASETEPKPRMGVVTPQMISGEHSKSPALTA